MNKAYFQIMHPSIQAVINEWTSAPHLYSFETRLHPAANTSQYKTDTPYIDLVFIIEVAGFFEDMEHSKPIKLHRERVISIDRFNSHPENVEGLRKDLEIFTEESYQQFHLTLSSFPTSTFTSDPRFMK